MAAKPKAMREIKQILRLKKDGKGIKQIARVCSVSKNTVRKYLDLVKTSGYSIDQLLAMEDYKSQEILLPGVDQAPDRDKRYYEWLSQIEFFRKELKRKGVNRWVLWCEYRQNHPQGYSYSQFCYHLQQYFKHQNITLPQNHDPGDKLYVDFAGTTFPYYDPDTGEEQQAQVFVGVLGYSKYSYVEAVPSQKLPDFIAALIRCLIFFGGVMRAIVPDNLKAAVRKSDRYEPDINTVLEDFANHYGTTIIPARSYKPKDKALAENLVKHAYSHIYAPLRNEIFFNINQINEAFAKHLYYYNHRLFQGREYSRSDLFEGWEKATLKALPETSFALKKYRQVKVQKNIHIFLGEDKHYYSVPFAYKGCQVSVIYTQKLVNIYYDTTKIASHPREKTPYGYTTQKEHMPSHYKKWLDRSPDYYRHRAENLPLPIQRVIKRLLIKKSHPEQAYKSCEGILSLVRKFGKDITAKACQKALEMDYCHFGFVKNIIENNMAHTSTQDPQQKKLPFHENIRGSGYYQ